MPANRLPDSSGPSGVDATGQDAVHRRGALQDDEAQNGSTGDLPALLEIEQALSFTLDLKKSAPRVLEIAGRRSGADNATLVLLGEDGGIDFEASAGTAPSRRRVRHQSIKDTAGRAVETRQPVVVSRADLSNMAVPVLLDGSAIGAITLTLPFNAGRDLAPTATFLEVVGSTIARAVKLQRLIQADHQRLADENAHLRQELKERHAFSTIVGASSAMRDVYERMAQVAGTTTAVLLRGEPGTGKDLLAHAIHHNSPRAKQPFIKVSCAALPPDLMEAELFGIEAGGFGGPHVGRKGRFEAADGGTLFLDEIGEMSVATQARLLRVLKEGTFERSGGSEIVRVNLRLVAASSKPLERSLADGSLRVDLYRLALRRNDLHSTPAGASA